MEQRETYYECYKNQEWDKLVEYCLERFEEKIRTDKRFNIDGIGDVLLSKI